MNPLAGTMEPRTWVPDPQSSGVRQAGVLRSPGNRPRKPQETPARAPPKTIVSTVTRAFRNTLESVKF